MLDPNSLIQLIYSSAEVLRNSGAGAPLPQDRLFVDYGMYRLGDTKYLAVGFIWTRQDGVIRAAKVQGNSVTDSYIIYGRNLPYYSAEIDPVTEEVLALYKNEGPDYEPKIDPVTGQVLQNNYYASGWNSLPETYRDELIKVNFPITKSSYYWAEKPYGKTIEFSINSWLDELSLPL